MTKHEGIWKEANVHIDYHLTVDNHHYSVHFELIGFKLDVRLTAMTVEFFHNQARVASHHRSYVKGGYTTLNEHMPDHHRRTKEWTPEKMVSWAERVGPQARGLAVAILESRQHPEQGVRACLGVLSLKKKYGPERLEAACGRALAIGAPSYHRVLSILEKKLENQALPDESSGRRLGEHENIRGAQYYSENQSEEIDHVTATYR